MALQITDYSKQFELIRYVYIMYIYLYIYNIYIIYI